MALTVVNAMSDSEANTKETKQAGINRVPESKHMQPVDAFKIKAARALLSL
jgi:hypothetical protein